MKRQGIGILGTGVFLPDSVRKNDWWPESIVAKWRERKRRYIPDAASTAQASEASRITSIEMAKYEDDLFQGATERRAIPDGMRSSEMEARAGKAALENAGVDAKEIDLLLTFSSVPDYLTVNQAAIVHDALGLRPDALAMMADSVCNSFIGQVILADALLRTGRFRRALLVQSSAPTRLCPKEEPFSACMGDGATAVVLGPAKQGAGLLGHAHFTDGSQHGAFVTGIPGGDWLSEGRIAAYSENPKQCRSMMMNAAEYAGLVVGQALEQAGLNRNDVDFYACHQPLAWVRPATQRALGLTVARFVDTYRWAGSMMACNIPLQLSLGVKEGLLYDGDEVVLYSLAGGMTATAAVLRWGK